MSVQNDRLLGRSFAIAAYVIPAGMAWLAKANAGPAMGGPMPPDIWDHLVLVSFVLAPFCGFMAYIYGKRVDSGAIKFFGGLALGLGLIVLLMMFFGPTAPA
jgi:hypothetical protein